jgi:hypothetical protein
MGAPKRVRPLVVLGWALVLGAIAWFALPYVAQWLRPQAPPSLPLIGEPEAANGDAKVADDETVANEGE